MRLSCCFDKTRKICIVAIENVDQKSLPLLEQIVELNRYPIFIQSITFEWFFEEFIGFFGHVNQEE